MNVAHHGQVKVGVIREATHRRHRCLSSISALAYFPLSTSGETLNASSFPVFRVFRVFPSGTTHENGGVKYFLSGSPRRSGLFFPFQYYGLFYVFVVRHIRFGTSWEKGVSFSFMHNGFRILLRSWLLFWSRSQVLVQQTSVAGDGFVQHRFRGARWRRKLRCTGGRWTTSDEGRGVWG